MDYGRHPDRFTRYFFKRLGCNPDVQKHPKRSPTHTGARNAPNEPPGAGFHMAQETD